jgi:tripartite ATP-independent transporter DctM subunit
VWRATRKAFWALILPIIILGGIIFGIYTPTEAAVVAVVYAFVVGLFIYQELRLGDLPQVLVQSAKSTAIVLMVCGAAMAAAYLLTIAQIPPLLTATILRLSGGQPWLVIFWINVLLLLVGCVMDLTPALLILAPILLPIAVKFGFDPVYFGVMMCVNLCIGLITPPVGTVLYIGCGLSKLSMGTLSRAIVLNISIMIAVLFLITYVPWTITFIPRMVGR